MRSIYQTQEATISGVKDGGVYRGKKRGFAEKHTGKIKIFINTTSLK